MEILIFSFGQARALFAEGLDSYVLPLCKKGE